VPVFRHTGGVGLYRVLIQFEAFPDLLRRHRIEDPDTWAIEAKARGLADNGFAPAAAAAFVRRVCGWGGYAGIGGRVLGRNAPHEVASALRDAHGLCVAGDPVAGLQRLTRLSGLAVSFASKHLKFLDPDSAVVLDSVISSRLGYPLDADGYRELLADCRALLEAVREAGVPYPFEGEGDWRLSDIEMVLFQQLRGSARIGRDGFGSS
jgi:hypothetical protein